MKRWKTETIIEVDGIQQGGVEEGDDGMSDEEGAGTGAKKNWHHPTEVWEQDTQAKGRA